MANKQPFRSIEMQGRQSSVRSDLRAADRTKQMADFAAQESQKLQSSNEALNAQRRFQNFNEQILDENAIQQQRLEASNLSTNSTLAAQANEILGRQALEGERMRMDQENQIRNMKNSQQVIRNQLQTQINAQEAKSLSNFGNQLLNFSQTLYKQKAKEINTANQRLQAQGQLDGMLENFDLGNESLNAAQASRVSTGMKLDNAATELDTDGLPNDATNIRAHNGFYTYGVQEGIAIKNSLELKGYLQQAKEDAIAQGAINFGDPNADQKLQIFIQDRTIDFMIERGLTSLPPEIQNKYLTKTLITAQSAVMSEFNEANRAFTIDSSIGLVRNQIRTGARNPTTFAEDLPNMLSQLFTKDASNFSDNLNKVFNDLKADTYESGDMTALDTLVTIIKADDRLLASGQDVINNYLKYQETFDKSQADAADDAASELAENLKALAQESLGTLVTVPDLTEAREYYWNQSENLPLKQRGAFREWLLNWNASDLNAVKNSNDEFLSGKSATPELIRKRIELNPGMPQAEKNRLASAAKAIENLATNDPNYKTNLERAQASIQNLRPNVPQTRLIFDPLLREDISKAIELRQNELEIRFNTWVTDGQGDKNANTMSEWLKKQDDLLDAKIELDSNFKVIELTSNQQEFESGSEKAINIKPHPIGQTNRNGIFYVSEKSRAIARSGGYGNLDSKTGVFLKPPEIQGLVDQYEKTGLIDPLLRDLATQANTTPQEFLQDQASLWGMAGQLNDPEPTVVVSPFTKKVKQQDAVDFALKNGLSSRGAIWFANTMMEESSGNPKAEHDFENGKATGYGLFAHRLSRRDELFSFAESRGKDKSDPTVQMEFAMSELRRYKDNPSFGHVWTAITAPNATNKQLVVAQRDWMRFARSLYQKRESSLINDLNSF